MKILTALLALSVSLSCAAQDEIRLPRQPSVSPDGDWIVFVWQRDLWRVPSQGGTASRLTVHPATDSSPHWSPDGSQIAFVSSRSGSSQIYTVSADGGAPRQVTGDSHRKRLVGFTPDGQGLLVAQRTDRGWVGGEADRLFVIDRNGEKPRRMLFDAGIRQAALSPDGQRVLFTRGSASWSRKGYRGAQASQLWLATLTEDPPKLERLDADRPDYQNISQMNPMWAPDSKSYYYTSDPEGVFDVYHRDLAGEAAQRVTNVSAEDRSDDGVAFPSLSADGATLVFRRRFDLYWMDLAAGVGPQQLELVPGGDVVANILERVRDSSARTIAFTDDGKQMAFVGGEDIYVMDRVLKEPVRVTSTTQAESSPVFSADGKRLFFVSDAGGEVDIWEATHQREDGIWWLAGEFVLRQVTDDEAVERRLAPSPTGKHIGYVKGTDLFAMDADGSDHRQVVEAWSPPSFDWSPDGKWLVYATQDSDYNDDVWIAPLDGSREPFNLSRHPDRDSAPRWSPDGTRIAFVSRRNGEESDIYYYNLTSQEEEKTERDRKLEKAMEAMKKKGGGKGKKKEPAPGGKKVDEPGKPKGEPPAEPTTKPTGEPGKEKEPKGDAKDGAAGDEKKDEKKDSDKDVEIDFEGLLDRGHRISIPDSHEGGLLWSPDGKKLVFTATVKGESGLYSVEFPKVEAPKRLSASGLRDARWLKESKEIVGLSGGRGGGVPAVMDAKGKVESFSFGVRGQRDWGSLRQVSFDQAWRAMRDRFYDERMNNRDWEAIRTKYRAVASSCIGAASFSELVNMMLGELNASHMGHSGGSEPLPAYSTSGSWSPTTYHLGLRFDDDDPGPGLKVTSVIPGSPCHRARSRIEAGEVVLAIDGQPVSRDVDLDRILTMDQVRDLELEVADGEGNKRKVIVRPASSVSGLLYDEWVEANRQAVSEQSDGRLGYLHIRGMNMPSFLQMEEDLFHAGHGKDGLVIDVRFNGGGYTTDHVLTALTQPTHAVTRSRGSGEGYPQDRKIYASWTQPIVLMCNEHSFSNAEILSHAVKQLGRGRLVGMRTAGGVISTGGARLQDGGYVRMPTRGWYLATTGEDMELNGCMPDIALWNEPGGEDRQLEVAVEALLEDVAAEQARERPRLESAAERRRRQAEGK